jgi:predicted membrane metal-binding protein/beta-lactamase superfamily II metal-dependent hydrolase
VILGSLALAWLAGVALKTLGVAAAAWLALPAGVVLARLHAPRHGIRLTLLCALVLAAVVVGSEFAYARSNRPATNDVRRFIDVAGPKRVQGVVSSERDETARALVLQLSVQRVETDAGWQVATGRLLVRMSLSLGYDYGDQVEVAGKLLHPLSAGDSDYTAYLAQQGIDAEMIYPSTHLIARNQGDPLRTTLVHLRERLASGVTSVLPEPEASLGAGVLLGTTHGLDPTLKLDLERTGTSWLVTADGFKLMIILGWVLGLSWLLHRRAALVLFLAITLLYTLFTGLSPFVVRGSILAILAALALLAGRPQRRLRALSIAAALMTVLNPLVLGSPSFWASFAGAAGILLLGLPLVEAGYRLWPSSVHASRWEGAARALSEAMAYGVASTPAMLPILISQSTGAPAVSLAASLLLPLVLPLIMFSSALLSVGGLVAAPLALALSPVAYLPLWVMVAAVRWFAALPGASVQLRWFGAGPALASYAVVGAVTLAVRRLRVLRRRRQTQRAVVSSPAARTRLAGRLRAWARRALASADPAPRRRVAMAALTLPVFASGFVLAVLVQTHTDPVQVTDLDVGAGRAVLVQAYGRRALIDGGPPGEAALRALDRRLPPWQRSLSVVVITDASDAHAGGLPAVLQHYHVGAILDAEPAPAANKPAGPTAQALATSLGATHAFPIPSEAWTSVALGAARLIVQNTPPASTSAASATVTLEAGSRRFLLVGDTTGSVSADARLLPASQIQTPLQMPAIAVVETDQPARLQLDQTGVPDAFRSIPLYRTHENGDITISTNGRDLRVRVVRGPRLGIFAP